MKLDFSTLLMTLDGKMPLLDRQPKEGEPVPKPLTLGMVSVTALLSDYPDERIDVNEKLRRFKLALKLSDGGGVDVGVEDVALLKTLIAKMFSPLAVGRACEILDPEPKTS